MKNARVIGIDFDDVIVSTNEAMARWHNRVYGTSYKREDILSYDLAKVWNCTREEMATRIREFMHSAEHDSIAPIDFAVESLKLLIDRELHIITARRQEVQGVTLMLAERHIPFLLHNFNFPNSNTSKVVNDSFSKSAFCLELGIEVFIEDHLDYALGVAEVGIPVLLFDTPWNQVEDLPVNVTRVFSWNEIIEKLR